MQSKSIETTLQKSESFLYELYDITSKPDVDFETKVQRLLEMGCRCLGLDIGILANIKEDKYQVVEVYSSNNSIQKGQIFLTAQTYCEKTIRAKKPVGFTHAGESEWKNHPAYQAFQLESYLGTVVTVYGQHYGTLNFSAPMPRSIPFTDTEKTVVRLMAQWISNELERRQATHELHQFFTISPEMFCIAGTNGYFKYINPALKKTLGYAHEELLAKPFIEFIHPDDIPATLAEVKRLSQGALTTNFENRYRCKDGSYKWLAWNIASVSEEDKLYAAARDITGRKQREEELEFANTVLSTQQEASPDGILVVDETGQWVSFNQRFVDMWQIPPDAIMAGTSHAALQAVQNKLVDPDGFLTKINYLYKHKTEQSRDEISLKDGRVFDRFSSPTIGPDGRDYGRVWYYRDITADKQTEEALRKSEERIRAVLDNVVDGIITIDQYGIIESFNPAAEKIFGYTAAEIIGQKVNILMPEPDTSQHDTYLSNYLRTGQAKIIGIGREVVGQRKDGSTFSLELAVGEMNAEKKRLFTGITRDITDRKEAQARQAQLLKELESANRELKDFAYVVSHDLKAPLRAISSLSTWLKTDYEDQLDEDGQELIILLTGRVKRMESLIEGVLHYSRVGRVREEMATVNLQQLVLEIVDYLAPPKNIEVTIETQLPKVWGEPTRIEQVFQNLLSNAIKFMDKPLGEIKLNCDDADDYWQFSVADNGPGIDQKYFNKIFQIFQTLTARDELESSGIGLSVVKKIIEMYGGQIRVESTVGIGTAFFFTLPKEGNYNSNSTSK